MPVPVLTATHLSPPRDGWRPLLVLGPSLGTSTRLWTACATLLAETHDVVAWDLPGHGRSAPATAPFSMAELAAGVLDVVDRVEADRSDASGTTSPAPRRRAFRYAGDSVGGAVGLQLLLDAPDRVEAAAVVCSGARIGDEQGWRQRATLVRRCGTPVMVEPSARRWFAPGFLEREPTAGSALLHDLQEADAESYALVCEALAQFDLTGRLAQVRPPVLALSGSEDPVATPELGRRVADGVADGRFVLLDGVGHLAPAEAPERTASALLGFFAGLQTLGELHRSGMAVRRAVLGDAHVDRATSAADDTTRDFQELITRFAWGSIWTRPGLDRRSRSMITLTALVAHGHWEELAMHVRAALTNGLTRAEVAEVLLQSAIYCGVPAANSAFRTAQEVFRSMDAERADQDVDAAPPTA
ncbi:MAG TPA: 4-carboxymuconolactone decarboxylase [Intrasporangium sp.]|uniref:bifunctional 3-oxoadipate enol-lactonase/4-carboxymuconolactone decarboxylase PcaDC n=1 Tax=Intrasporangium sp. TaxID=1925024 RepID=UPI002D787C29|nr:4-carboxymuconolactone decarboxylase [Intrasporangium sp.]HET7398649.1 4-carboxymuconolactone decarboxylase [Intrasporangium sp.]